MKFPNSARLLTGSVAAVMTLGLVPAPASAAVDTSTPGAANVVRTAEFRQLIGDVSTSTYFEVGVPGAGTYVLEYEITGVAFFDTYVDGIELGYVGGAGGSYRTRPIELSASGHLVQAVGPDGSGSARVYLVQVAPSMPSSATNTP